MRRRETTHCFLFHGPDFHAASLVPLVASGRMEVCPADALLEREFACHGPSVLLVDASLAKEIHRFTRLPDEVVVVTTDVSADAELGAAVDLSIANIHDRDGQLGVLRAAFQLSAERTAASAVRLELDRSRVELANFARIGIALMLERDRRALIREILEHALRFTTSDTAAIALVEKAEAGKSVLVYRMVHSDSIPDSEPPDDVITYPIDSSSLMGHVARTKEPLVIDDVANLPADAEFRFDTRSIDRVGYWVRSIMTLPLLDHHNKIVGVLQLLNRKTERTARIQAASDIDRHVIAYSKQDVELGRAMAGQVGILIENALLYAQIESLFEGFVKACVTAIDKRDPTTAGHSLRVAALTTDLATALAQTTSGPYGALRFSAAQLRELHYAALMHDLGKLGVDEAVLVKARKLPPLLEERVASRFDLIRAALAVEYEKQRAALISCRNDAAQLARLEAELADRLAQVERFQQAVHDANQPTLLVQEMAAIVDDIAARTFVRPDGRIESYLAADEVHYLQIPLGSLDEQERREIERHAVETCQILSHIEWTDDLKGVVDYASAHHEKLNGTGYPRRLTAERIPVQTRLITIADIFDALTAHDRPYKQAVSPDRALDIMQAEARAGALDTELVRILIDGQVYRRVIEEDWHYF